MYHIPSAGIDAGAEPLGMAPMGLLPVGRLLGPWP